MTSSQLRSSRLVVGVTLVVVAVLMFVLGRDAYSPAGTIAIGILGLVTIAISRK